jgi:hypothetical protein
MYLQRLALLPNSETVQPQAAAYIAIDRLTSFDRAWVPTWLVSKQERLHDENKATLRRQPFQRKDDKHAHH